MRFAGFREAGGGMSKVSEYRQHAKECRSLAKTVRFSQHREMLQSMAAAWESLADDRIRTAEGLERIAKLERAARKARKRS
jgi:septation ring formation regulator EzrA